MIIQVEGCRGISQWLTEKLSSLSSFDVDCPSRLVTYREQKGLTIEAGGVIKILY